MKNALYNALDLSCYIAKEYFNKYNRKISNIKLQKSLYFLFAYWGGFMAQNKLGDVEETFNYTEYLFGDRIEAWTYGPVIPKVYHDFDDYYNESNILNIQTMLGANEFVKSFIDDLLSEIFPLSDFKLVDISHDDNCWKDNYNTKDQRHNKEISKEAIINEYINK